LNQWILNNVDDAKVEAALGATYDQATKKLGKPDTTCDAEVRSFFVHAGIRENICCIPPTDKEMISTLNAMETKYAPARWSIPDDFLEFSHFQRVVRELNWKATPGHPYVPRIQSNKQLLGWDGINVDPAKELELWQVVKARLFEQHEAYNIRVFIKTEFHKQQKIEEGRMRLISSISIIDQIVDSLLFREFNMAEIGCFEEIPSKVGWSPVIGNNAARLVEQLDMQQGSGPYVAIDRSAWDWTCLAWVCLLEAIFRRRMCVNENDHPRWWPLVQQRYYELYGVTWLSVVPSHWRLPHWQLSCGRVFKQVLPGLQKSGCVNTISLNSHGQGFLHCVAMMRSGNDPLRNFPFVMGDDTIQKKFCGMNAYLRKLAELGAKMKEPEISDKYAEFAGYYLYSDAFYPVYRHKHVMNLWHAEEEVLTQMLTAYMYLYCFDTKAYRFFVDLLAKRDISCVRSQQYLIHTARGYECSAIDTDLPPEWEKWIDFL
jgi:hypothetical protein